MTGLSPSNRAAHACSTRKPLAQLEMLAILTLLVAACEVLPVVKTGGTAE